MLTTQKRETIVVYRIDTHHGVAVRTAPINLRALPAQRDLIDQAAAAQGKSRSDFMLEAACARAEASALPPAAAPAWWFARSCLTPLL